MSKICENCGNLIPDGSDVCPGCGQDLYNDEALQSVLSELSFALNRIHDEDDKELEEKLEVNFEEDLEVNLEVDIEEPLKLDLEENVDFGATIIFGADEVKKEAEEIEEPEETQGIHETWPDDGVNFAIAEAMDAASRKEEKEVAKKVTAEPRQTKKTSGKDGKKKRKKKKKSSGTTVLGIVIGLILALLVVAGGAFFMLYRMGFFELMSDDQLLATLPSSVEETVVSEAPVEEVPEEPSIVEESVVEEAPIESERPDVVEPELSIEEEPVEEGVEVKKFTLTGADDMTFTARGETAEIVYVISPETAQWDIEWESSDETVATVSNFGVITARRGGDCTITGTCGDFEVKVGVHCAFTVPTTVLDMNYDDITMDHEGQEVQMKIDYDLTEEQLAATVWESTDESVATVDEDGLVTAIANGTAVISASVGDYTASCIVRCVNVTGNKGVNSDDSEYVINYEDVTLTRKGEYFELNLKSVLGKDVPDFTWKSSNSQIATVDSKGIVTAVADGTCKITTSVDGDDFECIVRVRITG